MAEFNLVNNERVADCSDRSTSGTKSMLYDYIVKSQTNDADYPTDACTPYVHGNAQIDNLQVNSSVTGSGNVAVNGSVSSNGGAHVLSAKKNFDIPHPSKEGWRLRHTCLEGPENAVYVRGRLTNSNVIELPEYWKGLVDPESITVTLTQIGSSQDLIVDKIEWGSKIIIRSGTASNIDCYFLVHGERRDGEKLIVEYEGQGPTDYPGNNDEYSVAGYHYDQRG
ncbi:MAG: hypothetical protein EB127_21000 [Alphaproteobacteria bacterium]|nr:hypothetical protein [Alphaproteobacteria bacterium]